MKYTEGDLNMAKSFDAAATNEEVAQDVVYMPLQKFADTFASKYGIELMAGFYHTQEVAKKFADIEDNWHTAISAFAQKEVK